MNEEMDRNDSVTEAKTESEQKNRQNNNGRKFSLGFMGGPIKLPKVSSKDDAHRLFIRTNVNYYMRFYKKYKETGKKTSWNWSAFLLNPVWFFSRKMYLYGIIDTFLISIYMYGTMSMVTYMDNPKIQAIALPWSLLFLVISLSFGLFGNYLYICHMENKVVYPGERNYSNEQVAQINFMRGGISLYGIMLSFVCSNLIILLVEEIAAML